MQRQFTVKMTGNVLCRNTILGNDSLSYAETIYCENECEWLINAETIYCENDWGCLMLTQYTE